MTENKPSAAWPKLPLALILGGGGVILLVAAFVTGLSLGFGLGRLTAPASPSWNANASVAPMLYQCAEPPPAGAALRLYPEFASFWEAMDLLDSHYYGDLPNSEEAAFAAIRSITGLLGDPNTAFLTPQEADAFRHDAGSLFEGIGARVAWDADADTLVIAESFENQPAWSAGLRRGDLILAVDGESLASVGLSEAVAMIRGPEGSAVTLSVQRPGAAAPFDAPFDVEVVRARIELPTLSTDSLGEEGRIAYVRLNTFNENAGQLVREAVKDAMQRDPTGIILDLRGNSGGLLREAVTVAGIFLDDKTVLLERFEDGTSETYHTEGKAVAPDVPLAVLVDEASASASEIVAGALQDYGRAVLIGSDTFGKGSVQLPYTLGNGGIMRITIAKWSTPHDRTIDGIGLQPDIPVDAPDGQSAGAGDPQVDAALQYFQNLQKGVSGP